MDPRSTPRRARAAIGGLAIAAAIAGAGTALAAGERGEATRGTPAPPYTKRCAVEFRAYSDGSANIFCAERAKPFASVDAESGRIRFYR
ncbi:hypothetical protein HJD18_16985 [Thermoleophilia bacterium SCSIO 60948]|nr:hypothetical protein HJD18_16985 [Thermoleophilia bacterium SCSIO 60948]